MKIKLNISNVYLVIAMLYQLQDVVYEGGGILSKIIVGAFLLSSIAIALYAIIRLKLPKFFSGLNLLLVLFSLYGMIHIIISPIDYVGVSHQEMPTYYYIISVYISLLPIYVFYICTIYDEMELKKIQFWTLFLTLVSIIKFVVYHFNNTNTIGIDEITNNFGYLFIGIIPLLLFFNNRLILQYILLATCLIFVILSMKRGAIFVAFCCLIPFAIFQWKQSKQVGRIILVFLIIGFLIASVFFIQYLLLNSEYFVERIEATQAGDSSLRDVLYTTLWNYFRDDASSIKQLIGGGANYTLQVADNYAHNDWLEILVNQGCVGVIIYMVYWIKFWKSQKTCINIPELQVARFGIIICFIASFILTFFSMSYNSLPLGLTMALGICLGQLSLYQHQHKTLNI